MKSATRPDHGDPALRTRVYGADFQRVWAAAAAVLGELDRGRVEQDAHAGKLRAEAPSALGARSVVELHVVELETGEVQVDGRASPSTPFLDFGLSTKALRGALAKLDAALGHAKAE